MRLRQARSTTTGPAPRLGAPVVAVHRAAGPDLLREWDALVERTPGTDITQLSGWARVRATVGFTTIHVLTHRDGVLVGGAQLLCRRIAVLGDIGYLPYGPLVTAEDPDRPAVLRAVAGALRGLCPGRMRMLFVQPPEGAADVTAALAARGFRLSSAAVAPTGSIRIDLHEDLATIRSRFGRRLRAWPNQWERRGVTVTEGGPDDVALLVRLMGHSADRQGFTVPPLDYVHALYRELAATGNVAVFVGRLHGEPVAADLVTVCGDLIRGRFTGFDRCGDAARFSVPAAIRWEIIRWGRERGLRWLDFGGLSVATLDALLDGAGRPEDVPSAEQPKLTFGGRAFRYPPAVELIGPAPLRMAYDLANRSTRGRELVERIRRLLRTGRTRS